MIYVLAAVNIIFLLLLSSFVAYSVAKGAVVINYHKVMDKEPSMELAKKLEEEMKQQAYGGDY